MTRSASTTVRPGFSGALSIDDEGGAGVREGERVLPDSRTATLRATGGSTGLSFHL